MNQAPPHHFKLSYADKPCHRAAGWSHAWPGTPPAIWTAAPSHNFIRMLTGMINGRQGSLVLCQLQSLLKCVSGMLGFFPACWSLEETSCFLIIGIWATCILFSVMQCVWLLTFWKSQALLLAKPILFCNLTAWASLSLKSDFFRIVFYTTVFFFP